MQLVIAEKPSVAKSIAKVIGARESIKGMVLFSSRTCRAVGTVYSHILDDDRRRNAELFEEAFYEKKDLNPQMHSETPANTMTVPEGVDAELLAKVLANPEMAELLTSLAKTMKV